VYCAFRNGEGDGVWFDDKLPDLERGPCDFFRPCVLVGADAMDFVCRCWIKTCCAIAVGGRSGTKAFEFLRFRIRTYRTRAKIPSASSAQPTVPEEEG
jgi:hypothetical protein